MQIPFKKVHPDAILPTKATPGSAAFDLYLPASCKATIGNLQSGPLPNRSLLPTGVACAIRTGFVGLVCPRSGLAVKHGLSIVNSPGIIDSDYRGEIKVIVINHGNEVLHFDPGSRIGQLLIIPAPFFELTEVDELDDTLRGEGGFGSTGT